MYCNLSACLICLFVWKKNRYELTEEDGKQTLVVKDLKMSDTAEFSCKIGNRETSAKLQVEEGLMFWWLLQHAFIFFHVQYIKFWLLHKSSRHQPFQWNFVYLGIVALCLNIGLGSHLYLCRWLWNAHFTYLINALKTSHWFI